VPPPWLANRPDRPGGGGNRPPLRPGDLIKPSLPGLVNRPITGGGSGIGNIGSGNIGSGNITDSGNTNVIGGPEYNINNQFTNNQVNSNQFNNIGRPRYAGDGYGGGGYWGNGYGGGGYWGGGYGGGYNDAWASRPWSGYHSDWYSGNWNWGGALPSIWTSALGAGSWLSGPSTVVYSNPYYAAPTTTLVDPGLNYASPISSPTVDQQVIAYPTQPSVEQTVIVQPAEAGPTETTPAPTEATPNPPAPQPDDPAVKEANRLFSGARDAFKGGDYGRAQELVEKAIKQLPSDPTLHEFRALTLFAQKKYQDAAATLYAVLSNGPGWSWETMIKLYGDPDVYTQQLRALEEYQRQHPDAGDSHFVLAYHYLVMGSKDQAVDQFKEIVRVTPQDKLSASLLAALTTNPQASTAPADAKQ
jgi:Tetratricopeptide repeat